MVSLETKLSGNTLAAVSYGAYKEGDMLIANYVMMGMKFYLLHKLNTPI